MWQNNLLFNNKISCYDSETLVTERQTRLEFRSTVGTVLKVCSWSFVYSVKCLLYYSTASKRSVTKRTMAAVLLIMLVKIPRIRVTFSLKLQRKCDQKLVQLYGSSLLHFLQHVVAKPELFPDTMHHMPCKCCVNTATGTVCLYPNSLRKKEETGQMHLIIMLSQQTRL
jgi:hypothetical protein